MANCRMAFLHATRLAFSLAPIRAGRRIATRMAITAITTSNSMRVKAVSLLCFIPSSGPSLCFLRNKVAARLGGINLVHPHTAIGQRERVGQFSRLRQTIRKIRPRKDLDTRKATALNRRAVCRADGELHFSRTGVSGRLKSE